MPELLDQIFRAQLNGSTCVYPAVSGIRVQELLISLTVTVFFLVIIWFLQRVRQRQQQAAMGRRAWDARSRLLEEFRGPLVQNFPSAMILSDCEGRILAVNAAACELHGIPAAEIIGQSASLLVGVHDRERYLQERLRVLEAGQLDIISAGRRRECPDFSMRSQLFRLDEWHVCCLRQDISRDVSLRQRATESEQRYRQLVDNCPQGISIHIDGRFVFVNRMMAEMFRYASPDDMIGLQAEDMIVAEQRIMAQSRNQQLYSAIGSLEPKIYDFLRADGSSFKGEIYATSVTFDGQLAVQGLIIDVSERQNIQQLVETSERKYRALTENSPLAISIHANNEFIYVNQTMAELFGYADAEEMLAAVPIIHFREDQRERAHERYQQMQNTPQSLAPLVYDFIRKDGSSFKGEIHSKTLDINGQRCVQAMIWDVTERLEAQHSLAESEARFRKFIEHSTEHIWCLSFQTPVPEDLPIEEQVELMFSTAVVSEGNEPSAKYFGADSMERVIGRHISEVYPLEFHEQARNLLRSFIEGGYQTADTEEHWQDEHGTERILLSKTKGIRQGGSLTMIWGVSRDVTDEYHARARLMESEERYRELAQQSTEAIWRLEYRPPLDLSMQEAQLIEAIYSRGVMADCNDLMAQYYGYSSFQEVCGKRIRDLQLSSGILQESARARRFLQAGCRLQGEKIQITGLDGFPRCYLENAEGRVVDGLLVEIRGTTRDVTQQEAISAQLVASENRFRQLADRTTEGIWCIEYHPPLPLDTSPDEMVELFRRHGVLAECNDLMAELYGVENADLIRGLPVSEIARISTLQPTSERIRRLIDNNYRLRDELMYIDYQDGSQRIYLYNADGVIRNGQLEMVWGTSRDVSEHMRLQNLLQENEQRYMLALEGGQLGTWDWNCVTGETSFDSRWIGMLGYAPDALVQNFDTWAELVHPVDLPLALQALQRHLDGEADRYESEFRMRHLNGSWVWILARGKVISRAENGTPLRAVGTHMDITERKLAEEKLSGSEQRFRELVDRSTEAIARVEYDPPLPLELPREEMIRRLHTDGRMAECNDLMAQLYGLQSAEQIIGLDMPSIAGIGTIANSGGMLPLFVDRQFRLVDELLKITYSDGSLRSYLYNAEAVLENGCLTMIWGTCRDVTDRMQMQEQLAESEQRYALALEAAELGTWDFHLPTGSVIFNDRFSSILGYGPGELTWNFDTWIRTVHSKDRNRVLATIRSVMSGEQDSFEVEQRLRHRDGHWIWTLSKGQVIERDEHGNAVRALGTEQEITERRHAEELLRASERRYREFVVNSTQILWCMAFERPIATDLQPEEQVRLIIEDGFIEDCNDLFAQSWGYADAGELIGKSNLEVNRGMRSGQSIDLMQRFVANNYRLNEALDVVDGPDGSKRYFLSNISGTIRDGALLRIWGATSEMTELMIARTRLQESEQRYREFVAKSSEAIWRYEYRPPIDTRLPAHEQAQHMYQDAVLAECNDVFARVYGHASASQISGCYLRELLPPDEGLLDMFRRFIDNNYRIVDGEDELTPASERSRYFLNSAQGIIVDDQLTMTWGTTREITEQRIAGLALAESERRMSSMMEISPVGIFLLRPDGNVRYMNPRAIEMFGLSVEECTQGGWLESVHPDDRERVSRQSREMIESGGQFEMELRLLRKSEMLWVIAQITSFADEAGRLLGFVGMLTDITDRKLIETSLADSEKRNRELVHTMAEGLIQSDRNDLITYVNPNACNILGRNALEIYGHTMAQFVIEPDREVLAAHQALRREGVTSSYELDILRPDGSRRRISITGCPQFDEAGRFVGSLGTFQDITETRQLARQLQQAQKMEAVGVLAGGIAHDFNNILQAMLGFADLAREQVEAGSEVEDFLTEISAAGNRAADLVRQMLTFSRQSEQQKELVNLSMIVHESVGLLRGSLPSTIRIISEIGETAPVYGNSTQLQQVIMNLSTNAFHAMREQGGQLDISCRNARCDAATARELGIGNGSRVVELRVRDDGHGMDLETSARVFDPYFTTKKVGEGTGLGLATVHGIVRGMNGHISIDSELGAGTTVTIQFPAERETEPVPAPERQLEPELQGSEQIMIVDDEPGIVQVLMAGLRRFGYQTVGFTNSIEALEHWTQQRGGIDLIVTDQTMPQLTGDELSRRILAERPQQPILLCTGYSERITEEKARQIGIARFVRKPIVPRDLAALIRATLDSARAEQPPVDPADLTHSSGLR